MVTHHFLGSGPIGSSGLVSVWTMRGRLSRRGPTRSSLLVSLVAPPRRSPLGVQIPAQKPLGLLALPLQSRSIIRDRGSCTKRGRRLRKLRPRLLGLMAPITLADPRINLRSR